jgi:hypothetical protein
MIHPILWFLAGFTAGKGKTDAVASGCLLIFASGLLAALIFATALYVLRRFAPGYLSHHHFSDAALGYTFFGVLGVLILLWTWADRRRLKP